MITDKDIDDLMSNPEFYNKTLTGLMGDTISKNIEEVLEWIKINCRGAARYKGLSILYSLDFDHEEDIILFSLRWL